MPPRLKIAPQLSLTTYTGTPLDSTLHALYILHTFTRPIRNIRKQSNKLRQPLSIANIRRLAPFLIQSNNLKIQIIAQKNQEKKLNGTQQKQKDRRYFYGASKPHKFDDFP